MDATVSPPPRSSSLEFRVLNEKTTAAMRTDTQIPNMSDF